MIGQKFKRAAPTSSQIQPTMAAAMTECSWHLVDKWQVTGTRGEWSACGPIKEGKYNINIVQAATNIAQIATGCISISKDIPAISVIWVFFIIKGPKQSTYLNYTLSLMKEQIVSQEELYTHVDWWERLSTINPIDLILLVFGAKTSQGVMRREGG